MNKDLKKTNWITLVGLISILGSNVLAEKQNGNWALICGNEDYGVFVKTLEAKTSEIMIHLPVEGVPTEHETKRIEACNAMSGEFGGEKYVNFLCQDDDDVYYLISVAPEENKLTLDAESFEPQTLDCGSVHF